MSPIRQSHRRPATPTRGNPGTALVPGRGGSIVRFFCALVLVALGILHPLHAAEVVATLPAEYHPGVPLVVTLQVQPDPTTHVQAIEESAPAGWTIDTLSHGGVIDPITGHLKWGPFVDATVRTLSYRAIPPANATDPGIFSGVAVFDSQVISITGIRSSTRFPGTLTRSLPADYLPGISLAVTLSSVPAADVTAWIIEEVVPAGWVVNGITHDGGFDLVHGKVKWGPFFDTIPRVLGYVVTPPASERADVKFAAFSRFDSAILTQVATLPLRPSRFVRNVPLTYLPGVAFEIVLTATPAAHVNTYAVEEQIPAGWTPIDLSSGGVWDAANRKIKWGPFVTPAGVASILRYRLTPAADASLPLPLRAEARFDERSLEAEATVTRQLTHPESLLVRTLPAAYRPGQALTLTLVATPIDTALVYGIEEAVPDGWTASAISHGGAFDPLKGLVKWGPFFDAIATPRTLTCQVTPPADAFGTVTFVGIGRFDQTFVSATGADTLANLPGTVTRSLPTHYTQGVAFPVTLNAVPVPGVITYAVEEVVPLGWTVANPSDGGAWDPVHRKIKWGPFLDRNLRPLTYTLTPSVTAAGIHLFSGNGWFNGEPSSITGDSSIDPTGALGLVAGPDSLNRPLTGIFKFSVFTLLANDSGGTFLQVQSVSALSANGGAVQLAWPWIYYSAPTGFLGVDTFNYTLRDGSGATAAGLVTLTPTLPPGGIAHNIVSIDVQTDGRVRLVFTGVPSFTYHVETSPDTTTWTRITDRVANAVGQFEFLDTTAASAPIRFYRTLWP